MSDREGAPRRDPRDRLEGLARRLRWIGILALAVTLGALAYRAGWRDGADARGDTRFYQRAAGLFLAGESLYRGPPPAGDEAGEPGGVTAYTYLPPFAAASVWMAPLPYRALRLLWLAAAVAFLALAVGVTLRLAAVGGPDARGPPRPHLFALLLALPLARFVVNDLAHGQVNGLIVLLVAATLVAAERGRDVAAGLCLAAAVAIKPTPWLLAAWFVVGERRPRLLVSFGLAAAALLLVPGLRYGAGYPALLAEWYGVVAALADRSSAHPANASLAGALLRLAAGSAEDGGLPETYRPVLLALDPLLWRPRARIAAVAAVALGFGLLAARRRGHPLGPIGALLLAALLSPVTWKAHLVVLLLPLAALARRLVAPPRPSALDAGVFLAVSALVLLPSRGVAGLSGLEDAGALSLALALLFGWTLLARDLPPEPPSPQPAS